MIFLKEFDRAHTARSGCGRADYLHGIRWQSASLIDDYARERAGADRRGEGEELGDRWNNPGAFARLTGTVGDFSNFGSARANVQGALRVEF